MNSYSVNKSESVNLTLRIFFISALGLYLEMLLIRWIGTEIRIFAYLQNVVLVVCFLGLGMGCFTCRQEIRLRKTLVPLLFLTLLLAIPVSRESLGAITLLLSTMHDFEIWAPGQASSSAIRVIAVVAGLAMTFILMVLIWDMFVPIGRMLGRLIDDHPKTILAYSVNVLGGLLGMGLFVLLSVGQQAPAVWMLVLAALWIPFLLGIGKRNRRIDSALLLAIILLAVVAGHVPGSHEVTWSPYQKLVLRKTDSTEIGDWVVTVFPCCSL